MMYPRLKLARNLMTDDGVIFISIDDNEVSNLRKLCEEVFGEENFVGNVVWQRAYVANMTAKHMSSTHDHILIFARNSEFLKFGRFARTEEQIAKFKNPDNDPRGPWKAENLSAGKFYAAGQFSITNSAGIEVLPPKGRYWRCNEGTYNQWLAEGRIWSGKEGDCRPMLKKFLSEVEDGVTPDTWWHHKSFGSNKEASTGLKKLFDGLQIFDTPKPVKLIHAMLHLATDPDSIVLDFFGGACSTAHAVLEKNMGDRGSRRFIVVQLPEACNEKSEALKAGYTTIAEIGKERIRRAIAGIVTNKDAALSAEGQQLPGIDEANFNPDLGFRVFKLDSTNIRQWDTGFDDLESALLNSVESVKQDRSETDVLYELLLKYGIDLAVPIEERSIEGKTVYNIGLGALVVCLDTDLDLEVVEAIGQLNEILSAEFPMRVVFKDTGFRNDVVKTNALHILKRYGVEDVRSL